MPSLQRKHKLLVAISSLLATLPLMAEGCVIETTSATYTGYDAVVMTVLVGVVTVVVIIIFRYLQGQDRQVPPIVPFDIDIDIDGCLEAVHLEIGKRREDEMEHLQFLPF